MGFRTFGLNDVIYLIEAARWTVLLALIAFAGGGIVGGLVTLMRISKSRVLRGFAIGFVEVLQGTPLLMQLFLWFFMLTLLLPVKLSSMTVAAIALTLNAAAFFVEIWRGSIEAVARTQWEAAASIGMSRMQQLRYIIVPQAFRIALAPTVGMMVVILKGTALTSLIGFVEVTRAGQLISGVTFQPLSTFLVVGAIYLVLCMPLAELSHRIERNFNVDRSAHVGS
ncbi:amino acid ABC transporter permease [Bosea sp. (in: a-proteobacteria)]|uniref:amino acid ABC transporter permease n=1 Tax=Bosea sp. (in: a-proteobacteria) TaxID=1871050 RepID=UPI002632E65B|nr:amino acid ABC transporter permease [Bosea sp. (in: a-proteobacteria)]MCO5092921.1 amino acid ABC transporter permease [Bosea sp. (in: a-proteobacteria)]